MILRRTTSEEEREVFTEIESPRRLAILKRAIYMSHVELAGVGERVKKRVLGAIGGMWEPLAIVVCVKLSGS